MKIDIKQLEFIDLNLRNIVLDVEKEFGEQTVTSLYRIGDKGVHGTLKLRGIDTRCHDSELGKNIEKYVNNKWQYDPIRPHKKCCMFHDVGQGKHLHFQTHPNTKIKGD